MALLNDAALKRAFVKAAQAGWDVEAMAEDVRARLASFVTPGEPDFDQDLRDALEEARPGWIDPLPGPAPAP